jgi:hypothetical protein
MKKIKITESQLKKLSKLITENQDAPADNDPSMLIQVNMAIMSHLSDVQEIVNDEQANDRINFVKRLVMKYPDTNQKISTRDLDQIYDEMLGGAGDDSMNNEPGSNDDDENPFPDGYDFSLNESLKKKAKIDFDRYL